MESLGFLKGFAVLLVAAIALSALGAALSYSGGAQLPEPLRRRRTLFVGCVPFALLAHLALMVAVVPLINGTDAFGNTRLRGGYSLQCADDRWLVADAEGQVVAEQVTRLAHQGPLLYGVDSRGPFALNLDARELSRGPWSPAALPKLQKVGDFGRPSFLQAFASLLVALGLPLVAIPLLWRRFCAAPPLGTEWASLSAGSWAPRFEGSGSCAPSLQRTAEVGEKSVD